MSRFVERGDYLRVLDRARKESSRFWDDAAGYRVRADYIGELADLLGDLAKALDNLIITRAHLLKRARLEVEDLQARFNPSEAWVSLHGDDLVYTASLIRQLADAVEQLLGAPGDPGEG